MFTNQRLVLFDLPSKAEDACWSPNVWKTRLVLNYKNIPYETRWLDLPDIKPTLQALGVQPSAAQTTGASVGAQYTLPTIGIPDETFTMDSATIARKLEDLYPHQPLHLDMALHQQAEAIMRQIMFPLFPILMPRIRDTLITEHALNYWTQTRESLFGCPIDGLVQKGGGEEN